MPEALGGKLITEIMQMTCLVTDKTHFMSIVLQSDDDKLELEASHIPGVHSFKSLVLTITKTGDPTPTRERRLMFKLRTVLEISLDLISRASSWSKMARRNEVIRTWEIYKTKMSSFTDTKLKAKN